MTMASFVVLAISAKNLPKQTQYKALNATSQNAQTSAPAKTLVESQTTIPVQSDTYIYGASAGKNSNYGSSTSMVVKITNASNNDYNRISLLRFDLSGIDQNKGRITKAELKMFIKSTDGLTNATKKKNFEDTPLIISLSRDDSWSESAVTWNNYAGVAQAAGEIARKMGNTIPISPNGSSWIINDKTEVSWDITNGLRKDYLKDNAHQLSLSLSQSAVSANMGVTFYSRENGDPTLVPYLVITQESSLAFTQPEDSEQTVFEKIMSNISNVLYDEAGNYTSIAINAQNYSNSQEVDGSWSDLTYTGDVPTAHLDRLKTMALAYTNNQSSVFGSTAIYNSIVMGLQKWYDANPDHSNWFYDQIAYPQRIGQVLVLMRNGSQQIPVPLELNIVSRIKSQGGAPDQGGSQGTGANKINIALHWIYRGCLVEDKSVLDKGVQQAFYPMQFTTGEGLQHDYSYLQHGLQVYIGGYGWDIVNGISGAALYTVDTEYANSSAELGYLSNFVRNTYLRVIRGQHFMFNAFGRGIARENGSSQAGFGTMLERMKIIDPSNNSTYDQAIQRLKNLQNPSFGVNAVHSHYYSSDYTLQTKPGYTFELRSVSKRTLRNENGNGENLRGYFLADGATSIAITGTEYVNIYPTWDWSRIPGVTARQGTMVTPAQWGTAGNTEFVGGVSDTLRGLSVYELDNNATKAHKSWFFFDDEVVCLGAGISTSAGTQEVNTTLNQSLLQSDVITETTDGTVNTYSGNNTSIDYTGNLKWALQANIGYVLPNGGNIGLTAQPRTGKWSTINSGSSTNDVTKDVFTLWYKHGLNPTNGNYAYIVVPNKANSSEMQSYVAKNDIQILENSTNIQAVRHKSLNLHSFAFWANNQTYSNDSISVNTNNACLLMIQPLANGKVKINVADPTKKLSSVVLNIKWTGRSTPEQITVNLPSGVYAGKSEVAYIAPVVLPVVLQKISAKRNAQGVNINWTTASANNLDKIEIWRSSSKNSPAQLVGSVKANNTTGNSSYSFTDRQAGNEAYYYYLRFIDNDGSSSLSEQVFVAASLQNTTSRIYPNPAKDHLYISVTEAQHIELYNNMGKKLLNKTINGTERLELGQLPNGLYLLRTKDQNHKVLIKR